MTARKKASTTVGTRKSLSLGKRTLRDMSVRHDGPKAGFIMQDSIIVATGKR